MKAIFLILFVFSTLMLFLGFSAKNSETGILGNALIFGGVAIYLGMAITWILFQVKARQDKIDK